MIRAVSSSLMNRNSTGCASWNAMEKSKPPSRATLTTEHTASPAIAAV